MAMLDQLFMYVVDMSKMASVVIVMVIIARMLLRRFPKSLSYVLWSVVLFRLLCPVSFESRISIVPNMIPIAYHYLLENEEVSLQEAQSASMQIIQDTFSENINNAQMKENDIGTEEKLSKVTFSWQEMFVFWGKYVWIIGMCTLLIYNSISYMKMCKRTATAIRLKENIYVLDENVSPFVMGFVSPKIYIPNSLSEIEQEYIILHERIHIKRMDYIIKLLASIAFSIHWFNPLVWSAFILSGKDMEMSCDEAVIRKLGQDIKADYANSLLSFSMRHHMKRGTLLGFGESDTKQRIRNLADTKIKKKKVIGVAGVGVAILLICLGSNPNAAAFNESEMAQENLLHVTMDIKEHYTTKTGDPANLYYIDENNVLWGCGRNNAGQLGLGTQDYEFHDEKVQIAENVVHVDYSQRDFVIYLTTDNKLYGIGNAGCGALQQYEQFDWDKYINYEHYYISEPVLLMENIAYARCGQDDVACMTTDGEVWIWGTICKNGGYNSNEVYFNAKPVKVLENAVLITGGWFNHAALLEDGTVWTWGYNFAGNCGVEGKAVVTEPTKVADDVVMVWTGSVDYNVDVDDISDFEGEYPRQIENTIIKKSDDSYWICGANVGSEEKLIPFYFETTNYRMICTYEFHPILLDE